MSRVRRVHERAGRLTGWRRVAAAAAVVAASAAHAAYYDETTSGDLSNVAGNPTVLLAPLTPGDNHVVGSTVPSGPVVDPTGTRAVQDNDYVSFTVPSGYSLIRIDSLFAQPTVPIPGTPNVPGDRAFLGISRGTGVFLTGVNGPATGLLGWTLPGVSLTPILDDVLPDLGRSAPADFPDAMFAGATGFGGSLGSGDYTLWILDGDSPAFYDLNLVVARVPEPSVWLLIVAGLGAIVAQRRRRSTRAIQRPGEGWAQMPC